MVQGHGTDCRYEATVRLRPSQAAVSDCPTGRIIEIGGVPRGTREAGHLLRQPLPTPQNDPAFGSTGSGPVSKGIDTVQIAKALDLMGPQDFAAALAMLENEFKIRIERPDAALSIEDLAATRSFIDVIEGDGATRGLTAVRDAALAGERARSVSDAHRALDRLPHDLPRCLDATSRMGAR